MNHPLPQSLGKSSMAYEFVKAMTEEQASVQQPVPAVEHQQAVLPEPVVVEQALRDTTMNIDPNDAYESYRQRMLAYQSEQEEVTQRMMPQPAARALPAAEIEKLRQRDYYYDPAQYYSRAIEQPAPRSKAPEPFFRSNMISRGLAAAAACAVVAGCGLGIALTKQDDIRDTATRTLAYVGALLPDDQPQRSVTATVAATSSAPVTETVIVKKPIATATVDVSDVVGAPNSSIPLSLRADPAMEGRDISIRISGMPENAKLTAGHRQDSRTWLLSDDELANVSLVVPDASIPKFDLSVAAIETKTGELASPVREMTVALTTVQPASVDLAAATVAEPPAQPVQQTVVTQPVQQTVVQQLAAAPAPVETPAVSISPANAAPELQGAAPTIAEPQATPVPAPIAVAAPVVSPEAQALLQKGDVLLRSGDLVMARQFYLRAVDLGAPQGALGVAKTFDPAVFKELNVQGIMPDAAQAEMWYRKATAAGLTDAVQALKRFNTTAALPAQ